MRLAERFGNRMILVIDGDRWIRDSLSLLFECEGCRFMAFDNAADGLRAIAAERFDIIICDNGSPGIDGVDFLERAGKIRPEAIRILTAGYPIGEIAAVAARAGIHHCIPKPFTFDVLEKSLRRLLGKPLGENAAREAPAPGKAGLGTF